MILKGHCSHTNIFRTWADPKRISLQARRSSIFLLLFLHAEGCISVGNKFGPSGKRDCNPIASPGYKQLFLYRVGNSLFGFLCQSLIFWQKRANCSFLFLKERLALFSLFVKSDKSESSFCSFSDFHRVIQILSPKSSKKSKANS